MQFYSDEHGEHFSPIPLVMMPSCSITGTEEGELKRILTDAVVHHRWQEIPQKFVRDYEDQIHKRIKLEFQNAQVTLVDRGVVRETGKKRLTFGVGWRSFCDDNNLQTGDLLRFTLIQPSHFLVQLLNIGKRTLGKRIH
jgi:hypothetical protein